MEWVETTAKTVAEAQDLALDKLGVDELEAEFEILEEPRQGLFGRVRGQARVRARVQPKAPRPKEDRGRRRRKPKGEGGGNRNGGNRGSGNRSGGNRGSGNRDGGSREGANRGRDGSRSDKGRSTESAASENTKDGEAPRSPRSGGGKRSTSTRNQGGGNRKSRTEKQEEASMEEVQATVEKFLSGLTEAFGLDAAVELETSDEEIMGHIRGKHGLLLGPKARTLDAIQELTRVTAQRTAPSSIRIKVDVGGYREQRKVSLQNFAEKAAVKAIDDGVEVVLEPMSSADRKVIHDALTEREGVSTRSAGTDPRRHVIVVPDADGAEAPDTAADSEDVDTDA